MYAKLNNTIDKVLERDIPEKRKTILAPLVTYIFEKIELNQIPQLNFICTHNSRRSQFAQVWASTAAAFFNVSAVCNSGGVEVTAFNYRAIESLRRAGFEIEGKESENPRYEIRISPERMPIMTYSKLFNEGFKENIPFAAVMTCSHADENCPYIPLAEVRIPLLYNDPKEFDGTAIEEKMYDNCSQQIASELFFVFQNVASKLKR